MVGVMDMAAGATGTRSVLYGMAPAAITSKVQGMKYGGLSHKERGCEQQRLAGYKSKSTHHGVPILSLGSEGTRLVGSSCHQPTRTLLL